MFVTFPVYSSTQTGCSCYLINWTAAGSSVRGCAEANKNHVLMSPLPLGCRVSGALSVSVITPTCCCRSCCECCLCSHGSCDWSLSGFELGQRCWTLTGLDRPRSHTRTYTCLHAHKQTLPLPAGLWLSLRYDCSHSFWHSVHASANCTAALSMADMFTWDRSKHSLYYFKRSTFCRIMCGVNFFCVELVWSGWSLKRAFTSNANRSE